jgi:hypothetical protein
MTKSSQLDKHTLVRHLCVPYLWGRWQASFHQYKVNINKYIPTRSGKRNKKEKEKYTQKRHCMWQSQNGWVVGKATPIEPSVVAYRHRAWAHVLVSISIWIPHLCTLWLRPVSHNPWHDDPSSACGLVRGPLWIILDLPVRVEYVWFGSDRGSPIYLLYWLDHSFILIYLLCSYMFVLEPCDGAGSPTER